jgi:hypothetical protein
MAWLDEQIAGWQEMNHRNRLLDAGASALYDKLWENILAIKDEARQKGLVVDTHGTTTERMIGCGEANTDERREITFELNPDRRKIEIRGHFSQDFTIDICPDGAVCIKYQGAPISIEEASHRILGPLLFPGLQKQPVTPPPS